MKKHMLWIMLVCLTGMAGAQHHHQGNPAQSQKNEPVLKDARLNTAYGHYIDLKEALVAGRHEAARTAAAALAEALHQVKEGGQAQELATAMAKSNLLDEQRKMFAGLSTRMTSLVKGSGMVKGAVYLEYCPMANNNQGAYWLSNEPEIRNPYFGDKMLKCGSVKETIK